MAILVNIPLIFSKSEFCPITIINQIRDYETFAIKNMWNLKIIYIMNLYIFGPI